MLNVFRWLKIRTDFYIVPYFTTGVASVGDTLICNVNYATDDESHPAEASSCDSSAHKRNDVDGIVE